MSAASEKSRIRREVQSRGKLVSVDEKKLLSAQLVSRLLTLPIWEKARSILFFSALPDEPNLQAALEQAVQSGHQSALLRFRADGQGYEPCAISGDADLVSGRFGIREAGQNCVTFSSDRLDLVLVPGVAFDLQGRRLGRGGGHYDRLLTQVSGVKCGVAFDWQIESELPIEPHDVTLDCLLTPTRWTTF